MHAAKSSTGPPAALKNLRVVASSGAVSAFVAWRARLSGSQGWPVQKSPILRPACQ